MPTGIQIRDARKQLLDAAERVLLRDGPSALTSRAVTTEAGCAKGVLHKHFADFDAFLAEIVRDHVNRIDDQATALRKSAGTGSVAANLTGALMALFDPVVVAIVSLIIFRDGLRDRLREARPGHGVPILAEASAMIASYLTDECEMGRIAADADIDSLALSLIGAGHLLFAAREGTSPDAGAVDKIVTTIIADVLQRRLL
ncbi:TetR family transcriptional regulator [Asanoa ferruginea]|uniref:TetR family transcriptional regulator n=1 Tax=Asanoa ferruginea TaxID=53367 RepID=A0A3D9ZT96_9ACTN|nr:TetR/AcrR family transcriptional regulator [Asanoa ferruginea]REF99213.1 TetR family transcriptional regulator [Asanoa ferruginea]GIF45807.1 TetR family transcriptional regulator [Asanoa ferruginea]